MDTPSRRTTHSRQLGVQDHQDLHALWFPTEPGPVLLPWSGRRVWWTGRVAIGLRYEAGPASGHGAGDAGLRGVGRSQPG